MEEIWREIPGFEGYMASTLGRIKSLRRTKEVILKPALTLRGYLQVVISKKHYTVAYLVAVTFPEICGPWFPGAETDHINTIRTDNRAENIRFVDRKTNQNNPLTIANKHKTCWKPGRHHTEETKRRLSEIKGKKVEQLTRSGEVVAVYLSTKDASRQTGVNQSNINQCCLNRPHYHTAGGFVWRFIS